MFLIASGPCSVPNLLWRRQETTSTRALCSSIKRWVVAGNKRTPMGEPMSFHRVVAELPLITLTLWLQSAGIAALIAWVRSVLAKDIREMGALRSAALVVRLAMAVVVLHGLEILLWATFYRWRCLPSWDSAIYFSASSYSTLGCNDVSSPVRLANAWPAGERHRRVDVWHIGESTVCDCHAAY